MKKNIIYSLSLFLLLSLSACNQWLEVEPKTEIKSDKMFENETGFRDALIGCYMIWRIPPFTGGNPRLLF